MSNQHTSTLRVPLVSEERTLGQLTEEICAPMERKPSRMWWVAFALAVATLAVGVGMVTYEVSTGIGVWGLNKTIGWAFDITNFVFWVGIGHAGTLISAILFLFRQKWRTSINRAAEAMTLFAVMCAAIFPVIHMGRPWNAFWVLPYPNSRGSLWVNFRSPLLWDVFAISTYFTISAVFWYFGLIPDLATVRDRVKGGLKKAVFKVMSFGWTGSSRTWHRYETVYLLLAGLATPLVLSVHTIVSFDFATSVIPGWHTTIFPPYFVAGAVFSGFAMVLTLMIITRVVLGFEHLITIRHLENMTKVIIVTGGIVSLAYGTEFFIAWYSGNPYEKFTFMNRAFGPYAWAYWTMVTCNVVSPHLFWFKKVRTSPAAIFVLSLVINVGMWFERFVIIVTSLHRDFLPSSWSMYTPTVVEVGTFVGTFGLFFTLFLLFTRVLPIISIGEVKSVAAFARGSHAPAHDAYPAHGSETPHEHPAEAPEPLPTPALAAVAVRKDMPV
ncbi:molybdopterin-containing oxidoreductase family membrane subunit [Archangium gephyra]|uniref:Molybdopterin oxidoreductase n=1 Tax=Archangium gephyra TaxID=48 RepID=A0AAC8Q636_9BACT|nr:NrfD/PsrC family molybdoenzyme membrane anchor subunit [Archangium gephyra]AKJ01773.1 Molybdopterin oxidoreductase [Archangium gephyra]REG34583.1 molybdopterin-containing oxidoreductase family membrane subunit [Archangium gephyra]